LNIQVNHPQSGDKSAVREYANILSVHKQENMLSTTVYSGTQFVDGLLKLSEQVYPLINQPGVL